MRKNIIISSLSIITLCLINITSVSTTNTSALEYQSNTGVQFTINPTITISITGDHNGNLVINNLTPSNASDSNIINIVTESNAISGYSLYSTVGSDGSSNNGNGTGTGNPSTELRRNGTDTTNKFSSITTDKSSLSDFDDNTWGYSYATTYDDSTNTWNWSNYSSLPIYTSTGTQLVDTTTSGTTTISFKIGAKASNSQIAGDYTNTINFIGVAKANPQPIYMQNATLADCGKDMVDIRDNSVYKTALLADGNCWMLDNLRLDLTDPAILNSLSTSNTHVDEASLVSLKSGNRGDGARYAVSGFATWNSDNPDDTYNQAKANAEYKDTTTTSYGVGSGKTGVYYNYCAASAGSYCYGSGGGGSGNAQYDLCPAGWRMPTGGNNGEYDILYGYYNTTTTATDPTSLQYNLSVPLSGYYNKAIFNRGSDGFFWSSTQYYSTNSYILRVNASNVLPANGGFRNAATSLRCLLGS